MIVGRNVLPIYRGRTVTVVSHPWRALCEDCGQWHTLVAITAGWFDGAAEIETRYLVKLYPPDPIPEATPEPYPCPQEATDMLGPIV
jgi:hypothetical protein